ncbi:MAG: flagellar basal body P-ring formation chaperone FlgA [Chloroherpetonaceae bacterium]|nr:flagellar basal body P-ring formation chaperone FlgA [Chthonomonadaceae bacterium]MDW8207716.1 flagellar basal body P-ring formation chaperone FlgA [Chloroherpetonaceae bacterium]
MRRVVQYALLCVVPGLIGDVGQAQGVRGAGASLRAAGSARSGAGLPTRSGTGQRMASVPDSGPVMVTVRALVEVPGPVFTLGEIAELSGADSGLIARLRQVEIGTSPLPGYARTVTPGDITVRLRAAKLEGPRVVVQAPPLIRVSRMRNDVPPVEVTQAALAVAEQAIKDLPDATLEPLPLAGPVVLPPGRVTLMPGAYRGHPEMGTLYVPVRMSVDGRTVQTVEVAFRVRRRMSVVVASRTIEPNTVLTAADVSVMRVELPPGFAHPVVKVEEAVGKRARRQLRAHLPIATDMLETPPDLVANARVTIEFVIGAVRITAPGVAREAGVVGDTIRVYCTETKKEVEAVIVDGRTVRVTEED